MNLLRMIYMAGLMLAAICFFPVALLLAFGPRESSPPAPSPVPGACAPFCADSTVGSGPAMSAPFRLGLDGMAEVA